MCKLMSYHIHVLAVLLQKWQINMCPNTTLSGRWDCESTYTGDKGWGCKCKYRILHSSIGKAWWKHKNVVGRPLIGVNYFLLIELESFGRSFDSHGRTSAAWMNRSMSASNSHFASWISPGPVATTLRGPMGAVAISLQSVNGQLQQHKIGVVFLTRWQ